MSNVLLQGGASGTGQMTLLAPNTNTNQTANFPDASGTVMVSGNIPAFYAYLSATQTGVSSSTWTKVTLNAKDFDTANCFNTSTNRFIPNVAGYYQIGCGVVCDYLGSPASSYRTALYKNGSQIKEATAQGNWGSPTISMIVYMNGTTDYLELYGYMAGGSSLQFDGAYTETYMSGALVRGA